MAASTHSSNSQVKLLSASKNWLMTISACRTSSLWTMSWVRLQPRTAATSRRATHRSPRSARHELLARARGARRTSSRDPLPCVSSPGGPG
eukprot:5172981-Pyramimonas_sp.AAC.1